MNHITTNQMKDHHMNGKTVKKINRFVDILIANTPEDQQHKTRDEMIAEVREFWGSPVAQKFVNKIVNESKTNG
jgi:hypothetical protein